MWIPRSAGELERVVQQKIVAESSILDFKREIPAKSRDLARDVAAMANDGGVLVFGVGEDSSGLPTECHPFVLAGQPERVSLIIRTGLAEAPEVEVRELPLESDPSKGYIIVLIPASPRAPHMVTIDKDFRFYGRSAKGNSPLTEGEISRLYGRRKAWEADRQTMLEQAIEAAPLEAEEKYGFLHLVARPVLHRDDFITASARNIDETEVIRKAVDVAAKSLATFRFSLAFTGGSIRNSSTGWLVYMGERPDHGKRRDPAHALDLSVDFDGSTRVFCGRAAECRNSQLQIFDDGIAEITLRFLAFLGSLCEQANYLGPCDIGMAVTGILGARSHAAVYRFGVFDPAPFDRDSYKRTVRVLAPAITSDLKAIARQLASRFFRATLGENIDPFE